MRKLALLLALLGCAPTPQPSPAIGEYQLTVSNHSGFPAEVVAVPCESRYCANVSLGVVSDGTTVVLPVMRDLLQYDKQLVLYVNDKLGVFGPSRIALAKGDCAHFVIGQTPLLITLTSRPCR